MWKVLSQRSRPCGRRCLRKAKYSKLPKNRQAFPITCNLEKKKREKDTMEVKYPNTTFVESRKKQWKAAWKATLTWVAQRRSPISNSNNQPNIFRGHIIKKIKNIYNQKTDQSFKNSENYSELNQTQTKRIFTFTLPSAGRYLQKTAKLLLV